MILLSLIMDCFSSQREPLHGVVAADGPEADPERAAELRVAAAAVRAALPLYARLGTRW